MGGTKLKVGALDAALVFRADGLIEGVLPRAAPDRERHNALLAQVLLWAAGRSDVLELVAKRMESEGIERASQAPAS